MALNYLKEYPLHSRSEPPADSVRNKPRRRFPTLKFAIILVLNLFVWVYITGFFLDFRMSPASFKQAFADYAKRRGLVVTGVVCNSKMQAAIIADDIYYVGDAVKGFTITEINQNGVEFRRGPKKIFKKVTSL